MVNLADLEFIDTHVLLGQDHWLSTHKPEQAHCTTAQDITLALNNAYPALWKAVIMPFPSSKKGDYIAENKIILRAAHKNPQLIAVLGVNPHDPKSIDFVDQTACQGHVGGIVIWPILCDVNLLKLAENQRLWDVVVRYDLPVTVHVGVGNEPSLGRDVPFNAYGPMDAVALARAMPKVRFNLAHMLRLSRGALKAVADLQNVWMDLSGLSSLGLWHENDTEVLPAKDAITLAVDVPRKIEYFLNWLGTDDRVMFGSSFPFCRWWGFDIASERKLLKEALNSAKHKQSLRKVMVENACKFYRLST